MTDRLNALCLEYTLWNHANGLKLGSADEHIHDPDLTEEQRQWVADFSRRWEAAEKADRDEPESETCEHEWVENADEQHHGEGRVYCMWCGADGDA